jgi:toxin HigB-1
VIVGFADRATQDIFDGLNSKSARSIPQQLHRIARRKLDIINQSSDLSDLAVVPGLELEKLMGRLAHLHSIRINRQYRILFRWNDKTGSASDVEISKHYE